MGGGSTPTGALDGFSNLSLWVGWRTETRGDKPTKIPYNPRTGKQAESNNPKTWASRPEAETWAKTHGADGVGIMFGPIDDALCLGGVDIDACRNPDSGEIGDWAKDVCGRLNSYAEISQRARDAAAFQSCRRKGRLGLA
jgi:putative DNA primase/helicase